MTTFRSEAIPVAGPALAAAAIGLALGFGMWIDWRMLPPDHEIGYYGLELPWIKGFWWYVLGYPLVLAIPTALWQLGRRAYARLVGWRRPAPFGRRR